MKVKLGTSEVLSVIIITAAIMVISIVALYYTSSMLYTSTSSGEYINAQNGFIYLAEAIEGKASIEGVAGNVIVPTGQGYVSFRKTHFYVALNSSLSGISDIIDYDVCEIIYYSGESGGSDIYGRALDPQTITYLKGDEHLIVNTTITRISLGYDDNVDKWYIKLDTGRVLVVKYGSDGVHNYYTIYIILIKDVNISGVASSTRISFKIDHVSKYNILTSSDEECTLLVNYNGKSETMTFSGNSSITIVVSEMIVNIGVGA